MNRIDTYVHACLGVYKNVNIWYTEDVGFHNCKAFCYIFFLSMPCAFKWAVYLIFFLPVANVL